MHHLIGRSSRLQARKTPFFVVISVQAPFQSLLAVSTPAASLVRLPSSCIIYPANACVTYGPYVPLPKFV